jgi:CTP:molybdopterin cytidylyltransferase MocA
MPVISGIVLAAGAGTRHGGPKALVPGWLDGATRLLLDAGCERVVVVLGAGADEARGLLPSDPRIEILAAAGWADGMGASLRAGLGHATGDAVLITLVDLPGTPGSVVDRLLAAHAGRRDDDTRDSSKIREGLRDALRQATYGGRPGHPVLVGRHHWQTLSDTLQGDRGARPYLTRHGVTEVECGDLHHGRDEDT